MSESQQLSEQTSTVSTESDQTQPDIEDRSDKEIAELVLAGKLERHPKYETTTKSAYGANTKANSAYNSWHIKPSRTRSKPKVGRNRFSIPAYYHYGSSLHCFQFPSGLAYQERTSRQNRGSVRARLPNGDSLSGLTIDDVGDFLSESDGNLPIEYLIAQHGEEGEWGMNARENFVLEFWAKDQPNTYAVILYDGSANSRSRTSATRAGMLVTHGDPAYAHVSQILEREAYGQLSDLVSPDEVLASELPVITSSEYRNRSGSANAGGFGHEESLGENIIRQGEYYFKPVDKSFPEQMVDKPYSEYEDKTALGSHVPRDQVVIEDCQPTLADDGPAVEPGVYVRGTVRHQRNEHSMFHLHDRWHKVIENTVDMYAFQRSGGGRME